jgi:Sulfotransferase domain
MDEVRIGMWSGPRNISTAMMRAWGNRPDTAVLDEPFYAFYLNTTGKNHPGAAEIVACGETDWSKVVAHLTKEPLPFGKRVLFQKQMTHHLLPEVDRQWIADLVNCFLIRDPRDVILSYIKKNPDPLSEDLGFLQQLKIFNLVREKTKSIPPVIDAKDVLENPNRMLRLLCNALGVEFDPVMLSWPPGLRESDGIWAKYWYGDVMQSTSFRPYKPKEIDLPDPLREIHAQCRECYEQLYPYRLH